MADVEPSRKKAGQPQRHAGHEMEHAVNSQDVDLYSIAYDESRRTLDDQADELNRIRDRSVQFVVFVGAATAFLVGSGLQAPDRDSTFYAIAGVASAASVLMIVLLFLVLNPPNKKLWNYRVSAKTMIDRLIEADVRPSRAEFIRYLAMINDDSRQSNERLLKSLRRWYRLLVIIGSVQVTLWASLVWVKA